MMMSHDSGTAYLEDIHILAKTQETEFFGQLSSGARALDIRPRLNQKKELVMRHGIIEINHKIEDALQEVVDFAASNPGERDLILLVFSHYDTTNGHPGEAVREMLARMGISTIESMDCLRVLPRMTLEQGLERSRMPRGGHVLATIGCTIENWDSQVTCAWQPDSPDYCSDASYSRLYAYLDKVALVPPTSGQLI